MHAHSTWKTLRTYLRKTQWCIADKLIPVWTDNTIHVKNTCCVVDLHDAIRKESKEIAIERVFLIGLKSEIHYLFRVIIWPISSSRAWIYIAMCAMMKYRTIIVYSITLLFDILLLFLNIYIIIEATFFHLIKLYILLFHPRDIHAIKYESVNHKAARRHSYRVLLLAIIIFLSIVKIFINNVLK